MTVGQHSLFPHPAPEDEHLLVSRNLGLPLVYFDVIEGGMQNTYAKIWKCFPPVFIICFLYVPMCFFFFIQQLLAFYPTLLVQPLISLSISTLLCHGTFAELFLSFVYCYPHLTVIDVVLICLHLCPER